MNEVQENLDEILKEKITKLIPENIKQGVTILGVRGTLKEGTGVSNVLVFPTKEEMEADTEEAEDTVAIVYDSVSYTGTYRVDNGVWTEIGLSVDGQAIMNILNEVESIRSQYEGWGGTEEEVGSILDEIYLVQAFRFENKSASYGFVLNNNGYYESNNKNVDNSYAKCRLTFVMDTATTITLDCINSGESNFDFGLISNIDTTLSDSNSEDSSVLKSFKGQSSTSVVQVNIDMPAGEHYIEIKYRKDSSASNGNDSFQFKVSKM